MTKQRHKTDLTKQDHSTIVRHVRTAGRHALQHGHFLIHNVTLHCGSIMYMRHVHA